MAHAGEDHTGLTNAVGGAAGYRHQFVQMDTMITMQLAGTAAGPDLLAAIERARDWFRRVETACSRFDPTSEARRLLDSVGQPVPVSEILFEALTFALATAEASGGSFDPTIGHRLEHSGFDRNYQTGASVRSSVAFDERPTYRDIVLDHAARTVTLQRPLVIDLGAVAKGLAVDLAARELLEYNDFAIEAGGDLYVHGHNLHGRLWQIGLRHPRQPDALLTTLAVSNLAVCTSGDYERRAPAGAGHHLIDARHGRSATSLASVTVIAPTTMAADALATAAFLLGARRGRRLLEEAGVEGLLVTAQLDWHTTPGFRRFLP